LVLMVLIQGNPVIDTTGIVCFADVAIFAICIGHDIFYIGPYAT
jgi:hypothetical protein